MGSRFRSGILNAAALFLLVVCSVACEMEPDAPEPPRRAGAAKQALSGEERLCRALQRERLMQELGPGDVLFWPAGPRMPGQRGGDCRRGLDGLQATPTPTERATPVLEQDKPSRTAHSRTSNAEE